MSAPKKNKSEKQIKVSEAVLEIIAREGLNGLSHSKVSRRSGVSRAWIYEYLGADKQGLIAHAAEVLAEDFSRAKVSLPRTREELNTQLREGLNFVFDTGATRPVVVQMYFRYRGSDNPIGVAIAKYERQWLRSAQKTLIDLLKLPKEQAELLAELMLTLRLGFTHRVITDPKPRLARDRAESIFAKIHELLTLGGSIWTSGPA